MRSSRGTGSSCTCTPLSRLESPNSFNRSKRQPGDMAGRRYRLEKARLKSERWLHTDPGRDWWAPTPDWPEVLWNRRGYQTAAAADRRVYIQRPGHRGAAGLRSERKELPSVGEFAGLIQNLGSERAPGRYLVIHAGVLQRFRLPHERRRREKVPVLAPPARGDCGPDGHLQLFTGTAFAGVEVGSALHLGRWEDHSLPDRRRRQAGGNKGFA